MITRTKRLLLSALVLAGCGGREAAWDSVATATPPLASRSQAVLLDPGAERAMVVGVEGDLSATFTPLPIGRNALVRGSGVTPDGSKVLVLCRGDVPRRSAGDQAPALYAIDGSTPTLAGRYELSDPLSGLTLDPASRYAIVSAGAEDASFVTNPNELIVVDLASPPSAQNPTPVTLRSFGGRPERLDFTPELSLPGGRRRLLVAQSDRDLSLVDLGDLARPDITVKLTGGSTSPRPGGFAVSDGDAGRDDDARIAVLLQGDPNLVVVDFLPPASGEAGAPFRPTPNIVGLAGPATDVAFVRTDGGLRVAATVPSKGVLTLVEPQTGVTSDVELGAPLERIALVTEASGAADTGGDVALLWSSTSAQIAFVSLGSTVGKPYKSVQVVPLPEPISAVLDVPSPHNDRKVLAGGSGQRFFVLDLPSRTVSPLVTRAGSGFSLSLSPDGERVWVAQPGSPNLASIDFATVHPQNIVLDRPLSAVVDVARRDGGRALLAVHPQGAVGLTILDGRAPSLLTAKAYAGVLLGELP